MSCNELFQQALALLDKDADSEAEAMLRRLAATGHVPATLRLARHLSFREGLDEAIALLRPLADSDNAEACLELAILLDFASEEYDNDSDNHIITVEGRALLEKAGNLGCVEAQHKLGVLNGTGEWIGGMDGAMSRYWYGKAAEQGDLSAKYELGMMWMYGEGGEIDTKHGIDLLASIARQNSEARRALAGILEFGQYGVPANAEAARHWRELSGEGVDPL